MKKLFTKNIPTQKATKAFAHEFFENFLCSEKTFSVFFEGGLGAGKTFMIREILSDFGVKGAIASPTYTFVNEYKTEENEQDRTTKTEDFTKMSDAETFLSRKIRRFAHFDFYRFDCPQDFFARGFQEISENPEISCFVEWPEKISKEAKSTFSGKIFVVKIEFGLGVGMRKITVWEGGGNEQ